MDLLCMKQVTMQSLIDGALGSSIEGPTRQDHFAFVKRVEYQD